MDITNFEGLFMPSYYLGIDIGGTKTAISLADTSCKIITSSFIQNVNSDDFSLVQKNIFKAVDELLEKNGISSEDLLALGISCPGPLDLKKGVVVYVATTGWKNYPIVDEFRKKYDIPVLLENDCNCAAFAELSNGVGRGYRSIVYVTVSTGVGCGICVNGALYRGEFGNAGELGHICVEPNGKECACGSRGCLQLYASGTSMATIAENRAKNEYSLLSEKENITAYDIETAVRKDDKIAVEVWDDAMDKLGIAASIIYLLINPGMIVFGGGVSNAWDLMEDKILSSMKRHIYGDLHYAINIRRAALGRVIGTTGAILLAKQYRERKNDEDKP
jgi:glucokinase